MVEAPAGVNPWSSRAHRWVVEATLTRKGNLMPAVPKATTLESETSLVFKFKHRLSNANIIGGDIMRGRVDLSCSL